MDPDILTKRLQGAPVSTQFSVLSAGIVLFSLCQGLTHEWTFKRIEAFTYSNFLVVVELIFFSFTSYSILQRSKAKTSLLPTSSIDIPSSPTFSSASPPSPSSSLASSSKPAFIPLPLYTYLSKTLPITSFHKNFTPCVYIALALSTSRAMSMASLNLVSYSTSVVVKSLKLSVVMLGSIIILRKRYGAANVLTALLATSGAILFSLAEDKSKASTDSFSGIILLLIAICADSVTSNFQEKVLAQNGMPEDEMVFLTNSMSLLFMALWTLFSGELFAALRFCLFVNPLGLFICIFAAVCGYIANRFWNGSLAMLGADSTTNIGVGRKIVQIVLSFLVFPRAVSIQHLAGMAFFSIGLCLEVHLKTLARKVASTVK